MVYGIYTDPTSKGISLGKAWTGIIRHNEWLIDLHVPRPASWVLCVLRFTFAQKEEDKNHRKWPGRHLLTSRLIWRFDSSIGRALHLVRYNLLTVYQIKTIKKHIRYFLSSKIMSNNSKQGSLSLNKNQ